MFAKIISVGLFGMEAYMTGVEADISGGMPRFDVVGLPDTSARAAKESAPPSKITDLTFRRHALQ